MCRFFKEVPIVIEKSLPTVTKELKVFLRAFLSPAANFLTDWPGLLVCDFLKNHNFF